MQGLVKIGKGAFTTAYTKKGDTKHVYLKSECPIKECMSLGWFPETRLFPRVERLDNGYYKMDNLGKTPKAVKAMLRPRQYRLYRALVNLFENHYYTASNQIYFDLWLNNFESLPSEFAKEKQHLIEALYACSDYGQNIRFEISPRNIRIKNGFLILMDCFFCQDTLNKVYRSIR